MIILTKKDMIEILLNNGFFQYNPYYGKIEKVLKSLNYKEIKGYYNEYKER